MGAAKGNQHAKGIDWNGRKKVFTKECVQEIAKDLIEWSFDPNSMKMTQFACPRLLNLQRFAEWCDEYDDFAEAYAIAKQNLDINRFNSMNAEILNPSTYNRSEGLYDPVYDKYEKDKYRFESSLSQQQAQKPTEVHVKVSHDGIGSGAKVQTKAVSVKNNKKSK